MTIAPLPPVILASPLVLFGDIWWQAIDADGVEWICESLDGWSGNPASSTPAIWRPQDYQGVWSVQGFYGGRALTLAGSIIAPSPQALRDALDHLTAAHADALANEAVLGVDEVDGWKSLTVRAGQSPMTVAHVGMTAARVGCDLVAPRPIKRGPEQSAITAGAVGGGSWSYPRPGAERRYGALGSLGDIAIDLGGNALNKPRFEIRGAASTPSIEHVEQNLHLSFLAELLTDDVLAVDVDTRSVQLNGASVSHLLGSRSAWFNLLPGRNTIRYTAATGPGELTVFWHNAWW